MFLLCRKETNGLLEEMEDVSSSFFDTKIRKFFLMMSPTLKLKG